MAGSRRIPKRNRKPLIIAIAFVVIVVVAAYYLVFAASPKVVLDFTTKISIQVSTKLPNGTAVIHFFVPPSIGVHGATWQSHLYDAYGAHGNYPVYTMAPTNPYPGFSTIYVQSVANRSYTLGDFFAVWGEPLSMSNTLNMPTPPLASSNSTFGPDWYWDMCVGPSPNALHRGTWGNQTLLPTENIILLYSNIGCVGPG